MFRKSSGVFIPGETKFKKDYYNEEFNISIGEGTFINHFTTIRPNVVIGRNVDIRSFVVIEDDVLISDNAKIYQLTNITKGAIIKEKVFIGPGVIMLNTNRISSFRQYDTVIKPPFIMRGARIGGGATLLPNIIIGPNAQVGAGSVVTKSVPDNTIVVGNPAKFLKEVPEEERL
jgi:acetyltransferase-like isoleucine patch superfamily enzyme